MESFLGEGNELILSLGFTAGLIYLFYYVWKNKKTTFSVLARGLNARPIDSGVVGEYGTFKYILYFEEGHPGGAASGPTRAGYPSSLRVVIEKQANKEFKIFSTGTSEISENIENREKIEIAAQNLFKEGFKEIEYDGTTLDIKLYPLTLDSSFNANYFKNLLPTVAEIVDAL